MKIRPCTESDFDTIYSVINDGAQRYHGVLEPDCWHEPYMSGEELRGEIAAGVRFWGCESEGVISGVMGIQAVRDVHLIRHAYVRRDKQRLGIGGALLKFLLARTQGLVLVGTWRAAEWAIRFYREHGFELVPDEQIAPLLRKYWTIPDRQVETSIVLAKTI
jgi:GNAT superfamily N-acetyltransferase